jgi:hypothetical protein
VPAAGVPAAIPTPVMLGIAQVSVQLAFQRAFQHHLGQPPQQPTRPGQAQPSARARSASWPAAPPRPNPPGHHRVPARPWRPPLPWLAEGPDSAEAAPRVARAGPTAIRSQNPSFRGRGTDGLCSVAGAANSHPDTYAASDPNQKPGRSLIPGDGAAGDQGLRIGLRARQ